MEDARTIVRGSPGYPEKLARVTGAPERLRVRGHLGHPGMRRVAVVGTRHPDAYGLEVAAALSRDLVRAGASVVSGGAAGIDGAAHAAALDAGGHTVAVFGCGLDVVFPPAHRDLFARIVASGGALVSEYDDDHPTTQWTFPQRNRIVSGLCDAVVVVQAPRRSGALITARWAARQGVAVFAVPGRVRDPLAAGAIDLRRGGARVASGAAEVLQAIGVPAPPPELPLAQAAPSLEGPAAALYRALGEVPRHADEVASAAGMEPGPALAGLLALEIEGLCEQRPGHYFLRRV